MGFVFTIKFKKYKDFTVCETGVADGVFSGLVEGGLLTNGGTLLSNGPLLKQDLYDKFHLTPFPKCALNTGNVHDVYDVHGGVLKNVLLPGEIFMMGNVHDVHEFWGTPCRHKGATVKLRFPQNHEHHEHFL
eukprot:978072-Amphidinium_carterae.1